MKLKVGMIFIKNNGEKREIISIKKEGCVPSSPCSNCKGGLTLYHKKSDCKIDYCVSTVIGSVKKDFYKLLKNNVRKVK